MYIRVTRGRFSSANTDEAVRMARDQLVPALKQRPGSGTTTRPEPRRGNPHCRSAMRAPASWFKPAG